MILHGWTSITNWLVFLFYKGVIFLRSESPLNQELLKPKWKLLIKKLVLGILFKRIKGFLYIGEENKEFYRYYNVPEEKLYFTPYAVDNERFMSEYEKLKDRKAELKQKNGINPDKVVILFCGKLIEKKRPMDLLYAYNRIKCENKALVYVGDGCLRKDIESYIKEKNLKDVYLVGFKNQTEISEYYAMSDILVLPSERETWGLVINEAMNFKLPIIASNIIGCHSDLVKQNENGYVFHSRNVEKMIFCLKDLIESKEKRKMYGDNSRRAIQSYSYEKDIEGIKCALETCLGCDKNLKNIGKIS